MLQCLISDGPEVTRVEDARAAVALGGNVTLVCGTNLRSNPQPTIRWTTPLGNDVTSSINSLGVVAEGSVSLAVSSAELDDAGRWRCDASVVGSDVTRPGGGGEEEEEGGMSSSLVLLWGTLQTQ